MEKKLQRDEQHKMIAGVCAGLADYLSVDVTLVRVVFLLVLILKGVALIPYIILWIVLPKKIYGFNANGPGNYGPVNNSGPVDYTVPPQNPVDYSVPDPHGSFTPPQQPGAPFVAPPKRASTASIIIGIALVAFGSFFLLDEFNFLPDWEFDRLWPLIFIVMGLVLVFARKKQNPWEKENWHAAKEPEAEKKEEATGDIPPTGDIHPTE
ncbi:PspC domain-containing protein [Mucilaginibacter sp.]|uniref:PspC domain-containing protein n=1 Tax=Mucilaginibacter sp. TaxID=1882438 RepID=UPI0026360A68|nr:PspC domain-containing protein [Mucilaginibacter sp.]MDB4924735.1 DNA-binding transcriptional activator PspC [Mucilaginibacter sp.]